MAFTDFPSSGPGIELLQRSLERGRLAHGYLFSGGELEELEGLARTLAKTLNCERPPRRAPNGVALDCCDACLACRKITDGNHADAHWVRPESKSRIISVDQMREVMQQIYLKPTEAAWKVTIVMAADRLNAQAANAFLKTLEEPPARSIIILTTTEPDRMLETIESRCLRLRFGGEDGKRFTPEQREWLAEFAATVAAESKGLLARYRVLDRLLQKLAALRESIEQMLSERSPIEKYPDAEKEQIERWEDELKAAIEAEYRRQRAEWLGVIQWWLRDVWLTAQGAAPELLAFPQLAETGVVAGRLTTAQAAENLRSIESTQRLLHTNVQEALALEVGLLKLHL
ncbi:MAG: ATP-binding protein [Limisphaerales bacterium]